MATPDQPTQRLTVADLVNHLRHQAHMSKGRRKISGSNDEAYWQGYRDACLRAIDWSKDLRNLYPDTPS